MIYLTKNNIPVTRDPLLTFLSYSGGQQSACLLWMVIRGDIEKPDNFVVINADPGMENSGTYLYNARMKVECERSALSIVSLLVLISMRIWLICLLLIRSD